MDIGKYVKSFKAFDNNGKEIETNHESVNQWSINNPAEVKKIVYEIEDTWDAIVDSNYIYRMCGSSISNDNVLINGQCVFGYFHGMQSEPIEIKIDYPYDWIIGTALHLNDEGYYEAKDYDYIVDSPILLGKLTQETTKVSNAIIDVYTYSKTGLIKSSDILSSLQEVLYAEDDFTNGLPVDHYTFLFHFDDFSSGAWEHSYSSEYVFREDTLSERFKQNIKETVAHEFFHIVTPLNIHSELVEKFNFEKPVMSQHLWLYEGVTEWASDILLLRDSLLTLEYYLKNLQEKITNANAYDKNLSLTNLSVHSTEMFNQYANIYEKGAVVAALLDIRLLDLSGGKRGLREVINNLAKKYGPDKAFDENTFFDEFVNLTYPEIKDFFDNYIKGTEPLPIKEYFEKIGIDYSEKGTVDSSQLSLGITMGFNGKFIVADVNTDSPNFNIVKKGDVIDKFENEEITIKNIERILNTINTTKNIGDSIDVSVLRNDEPLNLKLKLIPRERKNGFLVNENADKKQIDLRNAWMKNL